MDTFLFFVKDGFRHVLDLNAYDHLLFLIVLAVVFSFKQLYKLFLLVTLFTIGHSLALFLSVYGILNFDRNIIEFLILVSILITAVLNIFTLGNSKISETANLFFAIFFGLIHGFGFSSHFKMIVGGSNKVISLLSFSVGVELAQILVVVIILAVGGILQAVKFSKRDWILMMSSIVIGFVLPLLLKV